MSALGQGIAVSVSVAGYTCFAFAIYSLNIGSRYSTSELRGALSWHEPS